MGVLGWVGFWVGCCGWVATVLGWVGRGFAGVGLGLGFGASGLGCWLLRCAR